MVAAFTPILSLLPLQSVMTATLLLLKLQLSAAAVVEPSEASLTEAKTGAAETAETEVAEVAAPIIIVIKIKTPALQLQLKDLIKKALKPHLMSPAMPALVTGRTGRLRHTAATR